MRGRKKITGRYATRDELEEMVRYFYHETGMNQAQVAKLCRVSESTVAKILDNG